MTSRRISRESPGSTAELVGPLDTNQGVLADPVVETKLDDLTLALEPIEIGMNQDGWTAAVDVDERERRIGDANIRWHTKPGGDRLNEVRLASAQVAHQSDRLTGAGDLAKNATKSDGIRH